MKKIFSMILAFAMIVGSFAGFTAPVHAAAVNYQTYGDYTFKKVSNPTTGAGEADGLNTNDLTGFSANRLNSYAWAVTSRGDNIYIGTNRTLFGSAANAVAENLRAQGVDMPQETFAKIVDLLSGGDIPINLEEKEFIPQIIKFDTVNGTTEVIYQPRTAVGEDGRLYYTDRDGTIVPNADVSTETASFRSVIAFNGNLYFGSLGSNMLQLVRVDEEDHAEVVFQTVGLVSSLRACCAYDDGEKETIYFGGQDTTYVPWRLYRRDHPNDPAPLPIVIRYLDPDTAGTDKEDWSGLIADYNDFGKYAYANVYVSGGGNVWDLCSYNGKLYLILAYDGGWALFRGEKGGETRNKFGWTWTEIVGDNGKYPLAMNAEVAALNDQYNTEYGCANYGKIMNGVGLLESTATPYVFNGKMYIGSFDNATTIQAQTVAKLLAKFNCLKTASKTGDFGPSLAQIFAPIYEVLSHPQHVWVMDENEEIQQVESANALLDGTTNDYVWRFIEYDGKLYTGTFDSSTAYIYYLDSIKDRLVNLLKKEKASLPANMKALLNGTFSKTLKKLYAKAKTKLKSLKNKTIFDYIGKALALSATLEAFLAGTKDAEALYADMASLAGAEETFEEENGGASTKKQYLSIKKILKSVQTKIDWLTKAVDLEGLEYLVKARALAKNAESGCDIFVTGDGENWEKVFGNGFGDSYNYGARTFTICNDELYVGTANPYYGAQLWKLTDEKAPKQPATISLKRASKAFKASVLKYLKKSFSIGAFADSEGKISYELVEYGSTEAEKYLIFNTKNGKVTVRKGTPKGTYTLTITISSQETEAFMEASLTKEIQVVVK